MPFETIPFIPNFMIKIKEWTGMEWEWYRNATREIGVISLIQYSYWIPIIPRIPIGFL